MSKYAIVTPCTLGYLPGLNANLNALDCYENDIDVFVIDGGDLPKDYVEQIKTAFRFKVEVVPMADLTKRLAYPVESLTHALFTTPYRLMLDLEGKYDVVSLIGADMVIVNNIMKWYEIADKMGYIVTAHNSFALSEARDLKEQWVNMSTGQASEMTVADAPGIVNIQIHRDLIEETLKITNQYGDNMKSFNGAIWKIGKTNQVLELPGDLWTCGIYYSFGVHSSTDSKGRPTYWTNRERISAIHRRWWRKAVREYAYKGQNPESQFYKFAWGNTQIWESIYRKFNTMGKVKIDYLKYYD